MGGLGDAGGPGSAGESDGAGGPGGARAGARPRVRRGRPPSTGLTRAGILDAARAIIEAEGPDALTLRRLGADLGSNHTAVLRHFSGKDDILLGLAERLIEEALSGFTPADTWRATLTDLARRIRRACLAHPRVAVLVSTRVSRSREELRGADVIIGALRQTGLPDREVARYYRALTDAAFAMSSYEASFLALDRDQREGDAATWRSGYLAAPAAEYPNLAAVAPLLPEIEEEDRFEVVLDLLLAAVELRARTP
ncbi:TetR/AcrR family transcriptional regulator [Nocardiopsis protaetiae]|uniref:TetR/AcrR family transcriptional regulator n=1 Tax=Nocardiopsis protaetiae TaxID=3382270 RepID=UPI00387B7BBD